MIYVLLGIMIASFVTFFIRAIPFIVLSKMKKVPSLLEYLKDVLPQAIMTLLVLYSVKDYLYTDTKTMLTVCIMSGVVVLLHLWKRNVLLSVLVPTILFMMLI
ncbi:branched-chain amino acid ABC transporter [Granulicatella sp. zg-ZJ]|uniref:branched-chain amino acid transporter permease n=1 Tax=Granulicatella sp. zg-ZJ TaxID=2678504 RepID=UPI0013D7B93C|nr:AzlD domain-containing protein [Granulicatella sp. zg-ZJ]MBS4750730.1 AzlD domain-containing protein [Carnobacteriaceae bacterium zg-ZUI78]NEW62628.1 branched-chain amino acid ABC transporter [Granulicatella sp. zg-ZJ]